jgi:hypothetical protein
MKGLFKFLLTTVVVIISALALWILCVQTIFSPRRQEIVDGFKSNVSDLLDKIKGA